MTAASQDDFLRVVRALGPYLDQLVFVGAWCHRLLQFHPLATALSFTPLMTEDADVATPERLQTRSTSLDTALTAGGFKPRRSGDGQLPVTKYYLESHDNGLYLEFIAPLRGSGYTRKGEPDDILAVAGITAQKLRYVELLLFEPWQLQLSGQQGFTVGTDDVVIQVANAASYLAQKVLTLNRRQTGGKRPKDALYIHDTLSMFGDELGALREPGARVLQLLPARTRREFQDLRAALFRDKELTVRAARIAAATGRANPPMADTIATVCTMGLERIFAP